MNQPENQSDRATAGDVEWLQRVVSSGRTGEIRNFPVPVARRILNSLRAPAAAGEPVAWMATRSVLTPYFFLPGEGAIMGAVAAHGWNLTPLYAAPPAPVVQQPIRFTDEHAKGLGAVMDKLAKANGPVVLSWEEADAVLDFAETALRMEQAQPIVQQLPRAWECPTCHDAVPWSFARCPHERAPVPHHKPSGREAGIPLYALQESP